MNFTQSLTWIVSLLFSIYVEHVKAEHFPDGLPPNASCPFVPQLLSEM